MVRQTVSFEDFDKYFIEEPDGYMPVYSAFQEDDDGNYLKIVEIDMICEWRLSDGKAKFFQVPYETKEQFDAIIGYLKATAKILNDKILANISEVESSYLDT